MLGRSDVIGEHVAELRLGSLQLVEEEIEGHDGLIGAPPAGLPGLLALIQELPQQPGDGPGPQSQEGGRREETRGGLRVDSATDVAGAGASHRQVEALEGGQALRPALLFGAKAIGQVEGVLLVVCGQGMGVEGAEDTGRDAGVGEQGPDRVVFLIDAGEVLAHAPDAVGFGVDTAVKSRPCTPGMELIFLLLFR